MVLPVLTVNHDEKQLRERSADVDIQTLSSDKMQKLYKDMIETMYADDGIGLAAPQVGAQIRMFSIGKEAIKKREFKLLEGTLEANKDTIFINPVWERVNRKTKWEEEGCLSVPGIYGDVKRYTLIRVEAIDTNGNPIVFEAKKYFARVIQHETDHLNGVLFIDKAKKQRKAPLL